jgi:hypothetical protein
MAKRRMSATLVLVALNIIIFIFQVATKNSFTETFVVHKGDLFTAPWTLVTSMFLHANILHIFINMWVLFMFGMVVEQRIGTKRFVFIYMVSGILASIASSLIYPAALGASGAIMGILGVAIILMPDLRVILVIIPMSLRTAGIILALSDIFGILPGVAHAAHLAGLASGLLYGLILKDKRKKFDRKFHSKTYMDHDDIEEFIRSGRI